MFCRINCVIQSNVTVVITFRDFLDAKKAGFVDAWNVVHGGAMLRPGECLKREGSDWSLVPDDLAPSDTRAVEKDFAFHCESLFRYLQKRLGQFPNVE